MERSIMKQPSDTSKIIFIGIVCSLLVLSALFAGCTSTTPSQPAATVAVTTPEPTTAIPATTVPAPQQTTAAISTTAAPVATVTTSTPAPVFTSSEGNVVAFIEENGAPIEFIQSNSK